jgi:hypothetical protein
MAGTDGRGGKSRQAELFPRAVGSVVKLDPNHRLVHLTEHIDWTELIALVQRIRRRKLKSAAGRPPKLRALVGAVIFRSQRQLPYRETEDQIRHYAPARYLCGLTETDWSPDANTIQDFEQLLGEDGMKELNEFVVKWAVAEKLADPTLAVADTTAQEATIPYPNEMRLMATFVSAVMVASKSAGTALRMFVNKAGGLIATAKSKLREFWLFAKKKSKPVRLRLMAGMANQVEAIRKQLGAALEAGPGSRLNGARGTAWRKAQQLHQTMTKLLPQIRYWIKTGFVATNKIVSLHMPEVYSIVRGKTGKNVEFGLNWGIMRLRGGFLLATLAKDKKELVDTRFAVRAVRDHKALFGAAPKDYAYDRGAWSVSTVNQLREEGVKNIGLAPTGRAEWLVSGAAKVRLVSERAQVEGGIGTIKCAKYGFSKPAARSVRAMGVCGQRAVLGFNLTKLCKGLFQPGPARA